LTLADAIGLVAALALFSTALALVRWKRLKVQNAKEEEKHRQQAHKKRYAYAHQRSGVAMASHIEGLTDQFRSYQHQKGREDRERSFREWLTIWALIAAGTFAAGSDVLLWSQLQDARALAVEARSNLKAEDRPYIWLTNSMYVPDFATDRPGPRKSGIVTWTWHITNYGKTPALHVRFCQAIIINNRLYPPGPCATHQAPMAPIPPGKDDYNTAVAYPVDAAEFFNMAAIPGGIRVAAFVYYTDAHGGEYETHLCIAHLPTGAGMYCPEAGANEIK
jgi:hypothetical protein